MGFEYHNHSSVDVYFHILASKVASRRDIAKVNCPYFKSSELKHTDMHTETHTHTHKPSLSPTPQSVMRFS